jgi:hypothetical protein
MSHEHPRDGNSSLFKLRAHLGSRAVGSLPSDLNPEPCLCLECMQAFRPAAVGCDMSHRGGPPGFVDVVSDTELHFPDYVGNDMFNTLGVWAGCRAWKAPSAKNVFGPHSADITGIFIHSSGECTARQLCDACCRCEMANCRLAVTASAFGANV